MKTTELLTMVLSMSACPVALRDTASNMVSGARHTSIFYFTAGEVCHLAELLTALSPKDRIHYKLNAPRGSSSMAEVIRILTRWVQNNDQLCNHIMQAQSSFHFPPFHFHSNRIWMNFLGFSRHSRNTGYSFILSPCQPERRSAVCVFI